MYEHLLIENSIQRFIATSMVSLNEKYFNFKFACLVNAFLSASIVHVKSVKYITIIHIMKLFHG